MKMFKLPDELNLFYIYNEEKNTFYAITDITTNPSDLLLGLQVIFDHLGQGICTPSHIDQIVNNSSKVLTLKEIQRLLKGTDFKGKYIKITDGTVIFDSWSTDSLANINSDLYEDLLQRFLDEVEIK